MLNNQINPHDLPSRYRDTSINTDYVIENTWTYIAQGNIEAEVMVAEVDSERIRIANTGDNIVGITLESVDAGRHVQVVHEAMVVREGLITGDVYWNGANFTNASEGNKKIGKCIKNKYIMVKI